MWEPTSNRHPPSASEATAAHKAMVGPFTPASPRHSHLRWRLHRCLCRHRQLPQRSRRHPGSHPRVTCIRHALHRPRHPQRQWPHLRRSPVLHRWRRRRRLLLLRHRRRPLLSSRVRRRLHPVAHPLPPRAPRRTCRRLWCPLQAPLRLAAVPPLVSRPCRWLRAGTAASAVHRVATSASPRLSMLRCRSRSGSRPTAVWPLATACWWTRRWVRHRLPANALCVDAIRGCLCRCCPPLTQCAAPVW